MEKRTIDLSKVDLDGLRDPEIEALKKVQPPADMPFKIGRWDMPCWSCATSMPP